MTTLAGLHFPRQVVENELLDVCVVGVVCLVLHSLEHRLHALPGKLLLRSFAF